MPNLTLTDEQAIELIRQLPLLQRAKLFQFLLQQQKEQWQELSRAGQEGVRQAAFLRGKDWDKMTEEEREDFINDLVHEDRECAS